MADIRDLLPMLRAALKTPREWNPEMHDQAARLVAYIEQGGMERALARAAKPDGSLEFTFSLESAAWLMDRARVTMLAAGEDPWGMPAPLARDGGDQGGPDPEK